MKRLSALIIASLLLAVIFIVHVWSRPAPVPAYNTIKAQWQPSYSVLLDRNGKTLGEVRTDFSIRRMQWIDLEQISPAVKNTFVRTEDKRFWQHKGVDWLALLNALRTNSSAKHKRGGSTISMQLAAAITKEHGQSKRRTIREKIKQMRSAWQLERQWSKAQILETWLNRIDFRGEVQGIDAASQLFAGKKPLALTNLEAIALAAMLPSPNSSLDVIASRACTASLKLPQPVDCTKIKNFLLNATSNLKQRANQGLAYHARQKFAKTTGNRIISTLDADIQSHAERILKQHLSRLQHRNVRDGAILVVENKTGEILAWVGSNFATSRSRFVDGVTAKRQAGSSLKPHLFALAIERGILNASSVLDDSPLQLQSIQGIYAPQNYDRKYVGPVSARFALGNSLNIPAVKVLHLVGIEAFIERLNDMGYSGIDQSAEHYGFALALGSAEVSLFEQVQAYRTLANGGIFSPIRLAKETDNAPMGEKRKMDEAAAFIVSDMLSDPDARRYTFGRNSVLDLPFPAAVKTGTSKAMRDNWSIGFTSRYTVGVWVGNFEGDSMAGVSGTSGAAPIWNELMRTLHRNNPAPAIPAPANVKEVEIAFSPPIEAPRLEFFKNGHDRKIIHVLEKNDLPASILQPVDGTIIAYDPDIPAKNQMIRVMTAGSLVEKQLLLNNKPVPTGYLWSPIPGNHQLRIIDEQQNTLDQVSFSVR